MTTRGSSCLEEPGVRALCVRRQAANAGGVGAFIRRAKVRSAFERNALGAFGQEASVRLRTVGDRLSSETSSEMVVLACSVAPGVSYARGGFSSFAARRVVIASHGANRRVG